MHRLRPSRTLQLLALTSIAAALAACGGSGGSAGSTPTPEPPALARSYPTGLAVASPTAISNGNATLAALQPSLSGARQLRDWARAVWTALRSGDGMALRRLAGLAVPAGRAHAAAGAHGMLESAKLLEKVLEGDASITSTVLAGLIDIEALFGQGGTNASCYGPSVDYASHQDGSPSSGQLPGGDVGLWLENETTPAGSEPCVAAQMTRRVRSAGSQTAQALLFAAMMRRAVAASGSLAMPAAGAATDLSAELAARIASLGLPSSPTVVSATIALDAAGTQHTYRLVLTNGASGASAKRGEMILRHTGGSTTTDYSGTLQSAGFAFGNDNNFGCSDQTDSSGNFKVAMVTTVQYSRSGDDVGFSARQGRYCGHPTSMTAAGSNDAAEVASFDGNELDASVKIAQGAPGAAVPRGATLGWRGDFTRYAGDYSSATAEGRFLLAWQAGPGDSHSRSLAATGEFDSSSSTHTVKGYFAYASEISTASGSFVQQGMICNWAGPGHTKTMHEKFQSQVAIKTASAARYSLATTPGASRITYAPTNSCDSSTTSFDADAGAVPATGLTSGEGVGTTNDLDGLTDSRTSVDQEIRSRGWRQPTLF